MTDDDINQLIDQTIRTHDNDLEAHGLAKLRQQYELMDSKTGIWSLVAADTFSGPDGPLTSTEIGALAWTAIGGAQLSRISGVARTPDGALRGTFVVAGVADGQVEADLSPGDNEASLYVRFASNGNYLMLARKFDGFVGMFRFVSGASTLIHPPVYLQLAAGERFKVRFVGDRIWVFRIVSGVEELLFDFTEPQYRTAGSHGIRLAGSGSAGNFRILQRDAL